MNFDFERMAAAERYKLMTATIVPRPIAWVTTLSLDGVRNAAPFSFFNAMSKDPPLVALGLQANEDGSFKHTARNILDTGEFVVNLVPFAAREAMSLTSTREDVDELTLAGLETVPSIVVKPARIAICPVAFECRLHTPLEVAPGHLIVLGRIVSAHVDDAFVLDAQKTYIDTMKLQHIGRMHGRDAYTRAQDAFQIARPNA